MKAPTQPKELIEEGNYIATLYRIIYIGTIKTEYMGETKNVFKVDLTWELNNEMKVWKEGEEPKPVVVSKQYTLSMGSKANLRPIVEGIIGGMSDAEAINFDIDELLGKSCLLNISHGTAESGAQYLKLATSKLMKGMTPPTPFNEQKILSFDKWDEELYQSLPEWLRNKIAESREYQWMKNPAPQGKGYDTTSPKYEEGEVNVDDIPF